MRAEQAYLFRHALLRDVACRLQMPAARARLHALALASVEAVLGAPGDLFTLDPLAAELAEHARLARESDSFPPGQFDAGELLLREAKYLGRAAGHAQRLFRPREAANLFRRLAGLPEIEAAARNEALRNAARSFLQAGEISEAVAAARLALAAAQSSGAPLDVQNAQYELASVLGMSGAHDEARALAAQVAEAARKSGDEKLELRALGTVASALQHVHDAPGRGVEALERVLEMARSKGDRLSEMTTLGNLGLACYRMLDYTRAIEQLTRARDLAKELGERRPLGLWQGNLGVLWHQAGDEKRASACWLEALQMARDTGDRGREALWLMNLGLLDQRAQRYEAARAALFQSLEIAEETGQRTSAAHSHINLGTLENECRRYAVAYDHFVAALEIARAGGMSGAEVLIEYNLSIVCGGLNRTEEAAAHARRSAELEARFGTPPELATARARRAGAAAKS